MLYPVTTIGFLGSLAFYLSCPLHTPQWWNGWIVPSQQVLLMHWKSTLEFWTSLKFQRHLNLLYGPSLHPWCAFSAQSDCGITRNVGYLTVWYDRSYMPNCCQQQLTAAETESFLDTNWVYLSSNHQKKKKSSIMCIKQAPTKLPTYTLCYISRNSSVQKRGWGGGGGEWQTINTSVSLPFSHQSFHLPFFSF